MRDKSARRQMRGSLPARFPSTNLHRFALEDEALSKCTPEPLDRVVDVVGEISLTLAGHQHVPSMVHVVVPLRRVMNRLAGFIALQPFRFILLVFEHQMD